jgi:hypothetical protein
MPLIYVLYGLFIAFAIAFLVLGCVYLQRTQKSSSSDPDDLLTYQNSKWMITLSLIFGLYSTTALGCMREFH